MTLKTIVVTGTHQSPATELIRQLKDDPNIHWRIYYLGRKFRSLNSPVIATEYELFEGLVDRYVVIESAKFHRHSLIQSLLELPKLFSAIISSYSWLKQIKPDIVVSLGGYISIPVLIASHLQSIKSITHEQTLTNSLTTKLATRFVSKIALSFDDKTQISQLPKDKVVITGNLIRQEIFKKSSLDIQKTYFTKQKPILHITGGNQGSQTINKIILLLLPKLSKKYNISHQVGKIDFQTILLATEDHKGTYICKDYYQPSEAASVLQQSSIVISRSGANICQELVALGKKCILVPLTTSRQGEQDKNALWAKKQMGKAVEILDENKLTAKLLEEAISKLNQTAEPARHLELSRGGDIFLKLIHELVL